MNEPFKPSKTEFVGFVSAPQRSLRNIEVVRQQKADGGTGANVHAVRSRRQKWLAMSEANSLSSLLARLPPGALYPAQTRGPA